MMLVKQAAVKDVFNHVKVFHPDFTGCVNCCLTDFFVFVFCKMIEKRNRLLLQRLGGGIDFANGLISSFTDIGVVVREVTQRLAGRFFFKVRLNVAVNLVNALLAFDF